jgi:hypothetical protein
MNALNGGVRMTGMPMPFPDMMLMQNMFGSPEMNGAGSMQDMMNFRMQTMNGHMPNNMNGVLPGSMPTPNMIQGGQPNTNMIQGGQPNPNMIQGLQQGSQGPINPSSRPQIKAVPPTSVETTREMMAAAISKPNNDAASVANSKSTDSSNSPSVSSQRV